MARLAEWGNLSIKEGAFLFISVLLIMVVERRGGNEKVGWGGFCRRKGRKGGLHASSELDRIWHEMNTSFTDVDRQTTKAYPYLCEDQVAKFWGNPGTKNWLSSSFLIKC